jgi:diguanylate cyclase (GGDEF)-like protein
MHLYDPATDRLHELTASDGVRFGTGWFGAHAALPDGRLLFGGSRGLMVVDADTYEVSTAMPPLVLADLQVNHRPRPAALPPEGLVLGPQDRSLRLEFAALDYAEPGRIRYAWQLQGYDSDWVNPGAGQRTAAYGQLPPGPYTLNVRASNAAGLWSESALLQIPLQVQPAWWQRTDLRAAAGVAAALLAVAAVRGHTRSLRRRQQALEHEVQRRTAQLREASLTDPLTGLRNRRYLAQHIDADTALAVRRHEGTPPSTRGAAATAPQGGDADLVFFLVDIDHFKQVNDQHGHDSGDAVLVQMRQRLDGVFRDSDHILRWGGEEFLVVARGTSRRHAAELAERLRAAVADAPFTRADGAPLVCTCSIGFAAFPLCPAWPRALDWAATLRLADAALYRVKSSGRDGWLGLVAARAGSEIALQAQAAGPLPAWQATGALDVAQRPGVDGGSPR